MDKEMIKLLKNIQKQSVEFKDILGVHKGIINTLQVRDNGIFAYCLFFGQNVWLRLNEDTLIWEQVNN